MRINFVGNFQTGYVGEISDETHLARELEAAGHIVTKVPRDQWKAWVDGEFPNNDWVLPKKADINIIAKWDKFDNRVYCSSLKKASEAPVFYWVWDYMMDGAFPKWHLAMAKEADLYLSGELGLATQYKKAGIKFYYFQFDVCDGSIPTENGVLKDYDVVFTGSYLGQGDRSTIIPGINARIPVKVFSWNWQDWIRAGVNDARPAVYGEEYNRLIARSKVVLGVSVEPHCFGYWSNRVGKVLKAGGILLQQYAPGMEQFLPLGGVEYFSTIDEAVEKIKKILDRPIWIGADFNEKNKFTSKHKIKQLSILMERFLIEDKGAKWILP